MKQSVLAKRRYEALNRIATVLGPMPTNRIPQVDILLKLEFIANKLDSSKENLSQGAKGLDDTE